MQNQCLPGSETATCVSKQGKEEMQIVRMAWLRTEKPWALWVILGFFALAIVGRFVAEVYDAEVSQPTERSH
jgi:hypothetical protein